MKNNFTKSGAALITALLVNGWRHGCRCKKALAGLIIAGMLLLSTGCPEGEQPCSHDFQWEAVIDATCMEEGEEIETCTKCGLTRGESRPIGIIPHNYVDGVCTMCGKAASLESIEVTAEPDKTAYHNGDLLDLSGMVVSAEYSDGTKKPVTGFTTTPEAQAVLSTGMDSVEVSFTDGGITKTTSFTINVDEVSLTGISISYIQGTVVYPNTPLERLKEEGSGLSVTANYNNGADYPVPSASYTLEGTFTVGQSTITVNYSTVSNTFTVDVNALVAPQASHYSFSGTGNFVYNKTERAVTITRQTGASPGEFTILYNDGAALPVNVGSYDVTFNVAEAEGFSAGTVTAEPIEITPLQLNWNAGTVNAKTYNRDTDATVATQPTLTGLINGDTVTVTAGTAVFASADAGTSIAVTASGYGISGAGAGNYSAPEDQPSFANAAINPLELGWTAGTVNAKPYDRSTAATVATQPTLTGIIEPDVVTVTNGTAAFASFNAGTSLAVTATGYGIAGADAANYTAGQPTFANAAINPLQLTWGATAGTVNAKTYDRTNAATVATQPALSGVISPDVVTVTNGTVNFANTTAGLSIAVTASGFGIGGANASNYTAPTGNPSFSNGTISVRDITLTGVQATARVYNPTNTTVTLTGGSLQNLPTGATTEEINFDRGSGTIATPDAGTGKPVTYTPTLTGTAAANYNLAGQNAVTVTINLANGLQVAQPSMSSRTHNSVTLAPVLPPSSGQSVQYARSGPNGTNPTTEWQSGTTFSGLNANTEYRFFARSAANNNYNAGPDSTGAIIRTLQAAGPFVFYWVDEHDSLITEGVYTVAAGQTLTVAAQTPDGYSGHQWWLNGSNTGQTGTSYDFISHQSNTTHSLSLFVMKDGKPYSTMINITVQ